MSVPLLQVGSSDGRGRGTSIAPEALESASPALYALALAGLLVLVVVGRRWTARAADEGASSRM